MAELGTDYASAVAPYVAALAMVKDAIGELFGPIASIESDDAELLRGPEPHHRAEAIIAALQRVHGAIVPAAWREITEDDRPPNDEFVLMGCWESWPGDEWVVEYGLYGSTKGGWIHGRMTHWLPSSFLPAAPAKGE